MPTVTPQLGLLEDDLVYRLSLLAVNVLQPLKDEYPNIVVVSGLRQVNTSIGQHELGEAVDIQIRNQSPELLYEVADYIQKFLNFDQLVLNWTDVGDGQGWIHVSFSVQSLRGQVLTKDLADEFHDGLFLVEPLSGEAAAQALREQADLDAKILVELQNQQTRESRLNPVPISSISDGSSGGGGDDGPGGDDAHVQIVACVKNAIAAAGAAGGAGGAFEITKRVAWLLRDEGAGLLIKNGGDNVIAWQGYSFSAGRLCYPDGRLFKILSDVGGGNGPGFSGNGTVDPSRYVPAIDPGSDITMDWLTCSLTPPTANTTPSV